MADLTPMKIQYREIKEKHRDCLLFFRLGDFYEMFDEDAVKASAELDLTLTTRDKNVENPDERTPMCGVPYHSCEAYIQRLIAKGYKVAICEQVEDPRQAKGLVKRDVVRVITPGTVMETSMLEEGKNNYICSIFCDYNSGAVCFADVSTGEFCVSAFFSDSVMHIINELGRFGPTEAVLSAGALESPDIIQFLESKLECRYENGSVRFDFMESAARVCGQFGVPSVDELGLGGLSSAVCAAGALLSYLSETQKRDLSHINTIDVFESDRFMELDYSTRRNLELTETMRSGEKRGSLLWVLDRTKTSMGGRLLRSWVERPLLSPVSIKRRHSAVQELCYDGVMRSELMRILDDISDIQRLVGKTVYGTANGRDLLAMGLSFARLPEITALLAASQSHLLREISQMDTLSDLKNTIEWSICEDPPFSIREGGMLRTGYSEEVDRLRDLRDNGSRLVSELEVRERERTGIKKMKVGYNKIFGYYLDVPRSSTVELPPEYIRKQTLVSNERYFTQELKELENTLLTAKEHLAEIEYDFFVKIRDNIGANVGRIQTASGLVAALDVLCSFAETAVRNNYVCPEIDMSRSLHISQGRHPVVELAQPDNLFVPNDAFLNDADDRAAIITGPNMAGKSTYMRQTALIVLMAQIGSLVPAKSAQLGIVDRIFTRIGASDDLSAGQSTFMVEMTETAQILKQATGASLIVLDEIGRGTSTYDGMAIARAVLEYCADKKKLGAKTLFATHYHELTDLAHTIEGLRNYNITAKKQGGELIFLRKIVPGAADDSYGIEVAKLAGIPEIVITKAKGYLKELESANPSAPVPRSEDQISIYDIGGAEIVEKLRGLSLDTLTPIEAINILHDMKKKVDV